MLSSVKLRRIAKNAVRSIAIGRKPNPGIERARKRYGRVINKLLRMKRFSAKQLTKRERAVVEKLKDPDYGPLIIERKGRYQIKTKIGETVRLLYSKADKECERLAELIKEECWKIGAHVTDLTYSSAEARKHMQLIPFDTAAELPPISKLLAGTYDARIFLGGEEDINWIKGLEEKKKIGAPANQKIREIIDRKKIRWCYFGWPVFKKQMFVSKGVYRKRFYQAIEKTFSPKLKKLCNYYLKALKDTDEIRITARDGTDLTMRIKGRPLLVADGVIDKKDIAQGDVGLNIPDGEVFLAPLEYSANGFIKFDFTTIPGFGRVENLKIKFKKGKVIWFSSPQKKVFKRFLDANTGEKNRIAELGIGTNPGAKYVGEIIVDEKIFGSIHIAIGNNRGAYHGKNKASSHQDMIKIMKGRDGNLYADGKLVMKNGMPVGLKI